MTCEKPDGVAFDLAALNEDPEFPCYDGDRHDFREVHDRVICRRGCGTDLSIEELDSEF